MSDQSKHLVGYMSPPEHNRFKKGKSGNPRGRPKKQDDIYTLLQRVLKRKVQLKGADQQMPICEAMIRKLRELALSGDARALNLQRRILDEAGWNQTEKLDPEEKKQRVLNLDASGVAALLGVEPASINDEACQITAPFQMRKRGVETKLIFSEAPTGRDEKLIRNIAKAHHWFAQIKSGKTFTEIAASEGASKRRIQQMIDLAFLAPDIIRDVLDGKQPVGFTSDWFKQHGLPSDWAAQRQLLATL
ncbi:DUF5681 domain-containing protein [Yoonia sp.]|uniref:DUF5681 domain-containing protein n=1 Tax=Yoonia sp. TaxID=2212373 RepID=UPI0025F90C4E|nr:DUF5681 domain-containing protein [Yoonia sp.]